MVCEYCVNMVDLLLEEYVTRQNVIENWKGGFTEHGSGYLEAQKDTIAMVIDDLEILKQRLVEHYGKEEDN